MLCFKFSTNTFLVECLSMFDKHEYFWLGFLLELIIYGTEIFFLFSFLSTWRKHSIATNILITSLAFH